MSNFDELVRSDLAVLVALLDSGDAQFAQLGPQQRLALVELITAKLTDAAASVGVDWCRFSDMYYQCLSLAMDSGVLDKLDSAIRSLNLISVLVGKVGAQESVGLLNPVKAAALFFECVPVSLAVAHELSGNWREIDVVDIRRLRMAKNLLTPTLRLKPFIQDEQMLSALDEWDAVYPRLP